MSRTDKIHINILAELCAAYGLKKIVMSPGSRSAPITVAFHHQPGIECYVIPDERSAGYFALGIAQYFQEPVGIICTSGTAALNLTPAIAEAFYQKLPLLVITADRPPEWVDQLDGQTINQTGIYKNFISYEAQFPVDVFSQNEQWHIERMVRDGFLHLKTKSLPVHFNIPLREPLYDVSDKNDNPIQPLTTNIFLGKNEFNDFAGFPESFEKYSKILLILGMKRPNPFFSSLIDELAKTKQVVVFTELLSNIKSDFVFKTSDSLLSSVHNDEVENLKPDLVISFGEMLLSKPLKQWIRSNNNCEHWIVTEEDDVPDVFQKIGTIFRNNPESFLKSFIKVLKQNNSDFYFSWKNAYECFSKTNLAILENIEWSDMKAFQVISKNTSDHSIVHFGNSSPVRYAQFFTWENNIEFFCNRGTAGIDGCTSTALGMANQTDKPLTLITGDISFLYDSNALWNNYKRPNLKIVVINNQGGNIFSLIPGPDKTGILEEYFLTHVPVSIKNLCKAYGISHYQAQNETELNNEIHQFFSQCGSSLLEIQTDFQINTKVWKEYFKQIKNNVRYDKQKLANH